MGVTFFPEASRAGARCGVSSAPMACLPRNTPPSESRRGQLYMATAVEEALSEKKKLIVEAKHRHRQNPRLSRARPLIGTARGRLHRNQSTPGAALLPRHPLPRTRLRPPSARLLHERPQQLRLPPEDLRSRKTLPSSPASKRLPTSRSSAIGNRPPNSATAPRSARCPKTAPPGELQVRRPLRALRGPEMQTVRALLHHAHATARRRSRHHHR